MRALSGLIDKTLVVKMFIAAFFAVQLHLFGPYSLDLFSEHVELVRHGVMVDQSVCERAGTGEGWTELATRYFDVYAETGVDLEPVEMRLRRRIFFANRKGTPESSINGRIAYQLDAICERAMELLDMRPKMPRIAIKIFKDSEDLNDTYRMLTGKSGRIRSFYAQDCGVIYTSEEYITDSVMAHEIAHAIIDSHYGGVPPSEVGEMLASYVDMHLED